MSPPNEGRRVKVAKGEKEPLGQFRPLPRSKRSGLTCGQCARLGRPCHIHGGKSTGPKSAAGKLRASRNATTHGLTRSPERVREDLSDERRSRLEALVATICKAELIENQMDVEMVRTFATIVVMEEGGREWLLKRGFVTVEGWRSVKMRGEEGHDVLHNETDVDGQRIAEPVVPEGYLDAMNTLGRLKTKLYEALRAGSGKRGDQSNAQPLARGVAAGVVDALLERGVDLEAFEREAVTKANAKKDV